MLAIDETLKKIDSLDEGNRAIIAELVDYLCHRQKDKSAVEDSRARNVELLSDMVASQSPEDEDYISEKVVDNALRVIFHLIRQPRIYRTFNNSIHMEYELKDRSYLEFEVFENRMTCMLVPQRNYDKAVFPKVSFDDMNGINLIVGEFYAAS